MATNKPANISSKIWAALGDVETPTDAKIETGWQAEVPKAQIENWVQNRQDAFNAHINERGIAEWDATTDYIANKSYVQGSNGVIYKAVQNTGPSTVVQDPTTDISKTYWDVAFQTPLVSGASIKTVNGENLLGSGNIIISGGGGTVPNATTEVAGVIEIATNSETIEGLDASKAVPPAGVKAFLQADTTKQDSNANLTALSSVVGAANQVPMFTDAGAMVTIPVTPVAQGLLEQTSKASQRSYLEVAGTDSPALTGIPTAPTADGSTPDQIANVAYVDTVVGGASVLELSSSGTIALAGSRQVLVLVDASGGNITLTLPSNDSNLGARNITFRRKDSTANTVSIIRSGTDTISLIDGSQVTSLSLTTTTNELTVRSDGSGVWWESDYYHKGNVSTFTQSLLDDESALAAQVTLEVQESTQAEAEAMMLDKGRITPRRLLQALRASAAQATEALRGTLRVGTQAEVDVGALDGVAVTPTKLKHGFMASLTTNGYIVFPSWLLGITIQWGNIPMPGQNARSEVTFPLAFKSQVFFATAIPWSSAPLTTADTGPSLVIGNAIGAKTGFNIGNDGTNPGGVANWLAIGI